MTDPCRHCGGRGSDTAFTAGFRAGQQQAAFDTYTDNIDAPLRASIANLERRTHRVNPFEGVTVVRWADAADGSAAGRETVARPDEDHIIRGTE